MVVVVGNAVACKETYRYTDRWINIRISKVYLYILKAWCNPEIPAQINLDQMEKQEEKKINLSLPAGQNNRSTGIQKAFLILAIRSRLPDPDCLEHEQQRFFVIIFL